jgi:hypothetical protein
MDLKDGNSLPPKTHMKAQLQTTFSAANTSTRYISRKRQTIKDDILYP